MKYRLKDNFSKAEWLPVNKVQRSFVRFYSSKKSPANARCLRFKIIKSTLSVVIPTIDAYRNGYFPRLLEQIDSQSFRNYELIVIRGDPRQGRAINIGAALAKGQYLLTLDDDTSLPDNETFAKLISVMEKHQEIGIAGGNNIIPKDASPFIQRVMKEIPRRSWEPVEEITDSDLAEHPCMIMRTDEFKAVGGENELIPRGLDPYLREAFRRAGKRVVVVPDVTYHHLPPNNLSKLLRQFYRNGLQAAYTNRKYPQWVIETPMNHGPFKARMPMPIRILRFPLNLLHALIKRKIIWFFSEIAYALGFLHELLVEETE